MRSLYSAFYGGPAETLWPHRTWLGESERGKCPQYTLTSALAEDAAERDTARSLKRDRDEFHWAWGDGGFFSQRASMMDTVNCDKKLLACGNKTSIWTLMHSHSYVCARLWFAVWTATTLSFIYTCSGLMETKLLAGQL
jgi:hypothetical protein